MIGQYRCRIFHRSQQTFCKRCCNQGHHTNDTAHCESYEPDCMVVAFRSDFNPLSNFYMCKMTIGNMTYASSEHAYQWKKCDYIGRDDLADRILQAPTPREVKAITSLIPLDQLTNWHTAKVDFMKMILKAKWDCSADFRQALMATEGMTLAEATQDKFWGVGVGSNLALHTKPSKFLGQNMLGRILKELRDEVEFHEAGNSDSMECNPTEDNLEIPLNTEVTLTSSTQVETTSSTKDHLSSSVSTSDVPANCNTVSIQSTDSMHTDKCAPVQPESTDTSTSRNCAPVQPASTDTSTNSNCAPVQPESTDTSTSSNCATVQPESTDTSTSSNCTPVQPESTDTSTSSNCAPVQPESTDTSTSSNCAPVEPESTTTMTSSNCDPVQPESTNSTSSDKSVALSQLPQSTGTITTPSGNNVPTPPKRPRRKVHMLTTSMKGNTMENYVKKLSESPSTKRKLSDGNTSPSSIQLAKTVRSDGADTVS